MNGNYAQADEMLGCTERLGLAVLRCRCDGSLLGLTTAAAELLGFPSVHEACEAAKTPAGLWHAPDEVARWLGQRIGRCTRLREFAVKVPEGAVRTLFFHRAGTPSGDGAEGEVVLLVMDPTDVLRRHERHLQIARLESIGASCGAIGHKLNNVLAGFLGYMTLLRRAVASGSESVQRYLDSLDDTCQRIQELAHQLLVIAQKNISCYMQPTEPVALVRQAVERARETKPELPVTFDEPGALPNIEADSAALQEALQQFILGTAAVLPGTREVDISLSAESVDPDNALLLGIEAGDHVRLRIRHSHAPARPVVHERLFDPYYTHDGKGKGAEFDLGKAWGIVALHNGTLTVSPQGQESTVTDIFLPVVGRLSRR